MDDLPHDILAKIFLVDVFTLKDKLVISAISRRLRRAALDTPLLWSSIDIRSSGDLPFLDILLERSRDALLDVSVQPYGTRLTVQFRVTPMPFDTNRVVAALLPHVARLRSLTVNLYELAALAPILSANLVLEQLEKLVVNGSMADGDLSISLSARRLRTLQLSKAASRDLSHLTGSLTDVNLSLNFYTDLQAFMEGLAANAARTLRRLSLIGGYHSEKAAPLTGPWTFPHLKHLNICFSSSRALGLLRCIQFAHIPYVHVSVTDRLDGVYDYHSSIVYPALAALLHGTEYIVAFLILDMYSCDVMSNSGKRVLSLLDSGTNEHLHRRIWDYLCDHFDAHNRVTYSNLDTRVVYLYRTALAERPPAVPEFTLHVTPAYYTFHNLPPLNITTLYRVVLMGNETRTGSPTLDMVRIHLENYQNGALALARRGGLKCARTNVELCTCGISQTNERDTRDTLRGWIREELGSRGSLSADAGCLI